MSRASKWLLTVLAAGGLLVWAASYVFKPDLQRASFQKHLKERVAPEELQAWAMKVLKEHGRANIHEQYNSVTNLHPAFRGLFINSPYAFWYPASGEDTAFIKVIYGGGGGHFGVEIGPTNRPTPRSVAHAIRYTHWAPGVCFFDGQ